MGIDLHRVDDGLELDCSFGHYLEVGTLLHWAYECGAFAPPAFNTPEEFYEKQEHLMEEIASDLGLVLEDLKQGSDDLLRWLDVYIPKSRALSQVPGDPRPSISTFFGSTGYEVWPEETKEMLKRLPKKHAKFQHFIDFLNKCSKTGFTVD